MPINMQDTDQFVCLEEQKVAVLVWFLICRAHALTSWRVHNCMRRFGFCFPDLSMLRVELVCRERERERKLVGPLKNSCGHDFPISSWIGGRGGDKVILSKFLSVAIVFGFPHWKLFWMDAIYDISIMYQIRFLSASSLYFVRFSFYRHMCSQNKIDFQSSYVLILCQAPLEPNDQNKYPESRAFRHWFLLFYLLHTTRFNL